MTLIYSQGFEGYDIAGNRTALDTEFNFNESVSTSECGLIAGRNGNGIAGSFTDNISSSSGKQGFLIPVAGLSSEDDWIVGFAFYSNHSWFATSGSARTTLLVFYDSDGSPMLSTYLAAGTINVRSGDFGAGTKLGFANVSLTTKVWNYFECKVKFHASAGTVTIRVNEEEVLAVTGVNTAPTADVRPSLVAVAGSLLNQQLYVDDIYMCDDQGSVNNNFLGDLRMERLSPNGNGNSSQFVGSDADSTDNYLLVDDTVTDDDATYVESDTATEKDTYAFSNSSAAPANIVGVSVKSRVRKSMAGSRNFVHVARSSASESDSDVLYPGNTYRTLESIFETDPATAAAWSIAAVNAAEFGYKVNA